MTPYQKHEAKWNKCKKCALYKQRRKVVLARGKIPCDVLFIGEAPGVSEDVIGKPFVGPAGKLLDYIIDVALGGQYSYALTNLVACFPKKAKEEGNNEPTEKEITACQGRVEEMIAMCKATVLVAVGKLVAKHLRDVTKVKVIHPAAILRMDVSQKGLAIQRSIVVISDAVEETFG